MFICASNLFCKGSGPATKDMYKLEVDESGQKKNTNMGTIKFNTVALPECEIAVASLHSW